MTKQQRDKIWGWVQKSYVPDNAETLERVYFYFLYCLLLAYKSKSITQKAAHNIQAAAVKNVEDIEQKLRIANDSIARTDKLYRMILTAEGEEKRILKTAYDIMTGVKWKDEVVRDSE